MLKVRGSTMMQSVMLALLVIATTVHCNKAGKDSHVRACYYTNWAQYRPGSGAYRPRDIDPLLCTHIIYSFANITEGQLATTEGNDHEMFAEMMTKRTTNPALKILLAVGGATAGSGGFRYVIGSDSNIDTFASSAITFLREHTFDGLDLDWEFPETALDKSGFTKLVEKLRARFTAEAQQNNKPSLMLTAAVGIGRDTIDNGYDVPAIAPHLDWLGLMAYDFYGKWSEITGLHSALYNRTGEVDFALTLNQRWALQRYISLGAPANKLVLGIPTYGRSFTVEEGTSGIGTPHDGNGGRPGNYTRFPGLLAYYEICANVKEGWRSEVHPEQKAAYAYGDSQWVGYDSVDTVVDKVQFVKSEGLLGMMVWTIDLDDFRNLCGGGSYPLMVTMKLNLEPPSTTAETPPVITPISEGASILNSPWVLLSTTGLAVFGGFFN